MSLAETKQAAAALERFLHDQTGHSARVTLHQPLAGGGSRETWLLEAALNGQPHQFVMRLDRETEIFEHTLTRQQEFTLLKLAWDNDITVPHPRFACMDETYLGRPFLLMDYVEGVSIGPKVVHAPPLKAVHSQLPAVLAEQLARIHQLDIDNPALDFLPRPAAEHTPTEQALHQTRQTLERLQSHNPTIKFCLRWLEQNRAMAGDADLVLVHGDYRIGNFILNQDGLQAIIDWEFSHVGSPYEDLAWPCVRDWRFGKGHLHFGGISDRETFITAYEAASGQAIDRDTLDYWEIMGNLRWAVTCLSQAQRHLSGQDPSVEFASLGRRSAEMQLECLRLIQQKGL